jgi:excisionase family DNA binding protein
MSTQIVWLTVDQAAERLKCSKKVIYRAVAPGRLRAARIGGRRAFRLLPHWVDDDALATSEQPRENEAA